MKFTRGPRILSRRQALVGGACFSASTALIKYGEAAASAIEAHGMSAFGDLKYLPDFQYLDYVNSNAPKGGMFSFVAGRGTATFNSLNAYILEGEPAGGMDATFSSLMARAYDEPDAMYGLAAERVTISSDRREYNFILRDGITFHDGSKIAAEDVAYSLTLLKTHGHPNIQATLRSLESAKWDGNRRVVIRFEANRPRDAPLVAASLPIFSKRFYSEHPFQVSTLDIPLGSGPYKVKTFEPGRFIEFQRIAKWWGEALPISRGLNNFDFVRIEYFRDRVVGFEAFAAKGYFFREELSSSVWSTGYDFPAVRNGHIKRETIPNGKPSSGAQGWFINTRREKFKDQRLREALALAFDFEWTNETLMFGLYQRTHSYFQNSEMMASGLPAEHELAILQPFWGRIPKDVFGNPWSPPVSDGSGQDRNMLRRAGQLLNEAGWTVKGGRRENASGIQLKIEFLIYESILEPQHSAYLKNLTVLGIDAQVRKVDPVQYRSRINSFDFDITAYRLIVDVTPGEALKNYFSSGAADTKGSLNLSGIADPVVDSLIEQAIAADSRVRLNSVCRALDRLLRAGHYWVPQWNKPVHWIAYWDRFGAPATKPRYARGAPETWWYDEDKAPKN